MKVIRTKLPGCVVIEPAVFGDERGFFYEGWNAARFAEHDLPSHFVQHNVSRSQRGVLRGLHYQWPGNVQGKLVSVLEGEVYDVAVDIRRGSPTFGQHAAEHAFILDFQRRAPGAVAEHDVLAIGQDQAQAAAFDVLQQLDRGARGGCQC